METNRLYLLLGLFAMLVGGGWGLYAHTFAAVIIVMGFYGIVVAFAELISYVVDGLVYGCWK